MSAIRTQNPPRRHDTRRVSAAQRVFTGAAVALAVILLGDALFGDRGLVALSHREQEVARRQAAVARQQARVDAVKDEVERYRKDPATIEERARRDFNLVRPGEKLIIIRDVPSPKDAH
jgi:cell division protein FtsB